MFDFGLRLLAAINNERLITAPSSKQEPIDLPAFHEADAPIERWTEDRLGRGPLVEVLAQKILRSQMPVIAVRGDFGDGKSSVLNLLRLQLRESAIVVSFSSWLPDSEQTLIRDLSSDIAAECSKHFIVPSLRTQLRKLASILAGSVSYFKALPEVLPAHTQREEMCRLGEVLGRIPRRIVVLIDEVDRMQKSEILTLLKLIRGISTLRNVTFVCALNQSHVEKLTLDAQGVDSHEFFEKFFPVSIDLPKPSAEVLRATLCDRLSALFDPWFADPEEKKVFSDGLKKLWDDILAHVCTNIRKTTLLANDIEAAATLVQGEVNPLDVCALTSMRRFFPSVYRIIWTNAAFFSNSNNWWKSPSFQRNEELASETEKIAKAIKATPEASTDDTHIKGLVAMMFPDRAKELFNGARRSSEGNSSALHNAEVGKRIAHPDYFPIYFHCEVPEMVFSSREMSAFLATIESAGSEAEREKIFQNKLCSIEQDSIRRFDFIHKLCLRLTSIPLQIARSLAMAIAQNTDKLSDEMFVSESNRVVGGTFAVAELLAGSDEVNNFLSECIHVAASDLFAVRLYKWSTTERDRNQVLRNYTHIKESVLKAAFSKRMTARYSMGSTFVPTRPDLHAFFVWAGIDDVERQKEIDFWRRFIGQDKRKLAQAFNLILPTGVCWDAGSPDFIERLIPRELLKKLYDELPPDGPLEKVDDDALQRLKRYLDGDIKPGEVLGSTGMWL